MVLGHDIRQTRRTRDVQITHNITFDTMLLNTETLQGLRDSRFYKPSPIQLHGIPLGKCGFDLLLEAKSGTGKTAVFAVVALEKLDLSKGLQVVILAPTREIAAQICDVLKQIGAGYKGLQVVVVMGGLPVQEDIEKFKRNVHIVVASPGRLCHLIKDKHVDTSRVRLLVLDEADKLVEKSFQEDVKYIFSCLPTQKQVIMSSATFTESAKSFIMSYVQNAQHVRPDSNCVLLGVDQKISTVKYNSNIVKQTQHRFQEVLKIFSNMQFKQCLIFCNYQARVSEVHKLLLRAKWPAEQLYGDQEQTDRLEALKTLQEYKCRILIATDLAARGIDASNIDLVINFEPPLEWQTYLHRIGRAGRYGSYGMAITILSEGVESKKFHAMLEPVKDTINIRDLWFGDEITLNQYIPPRLIPSKNEKVPYKSKEIVQESQELWKILTCEKNADQNSLESFENLCASFDKSCSDIETFDELLKSLEGHLHVDKNLSFNHININDGNSVGICVTLKKYLRLISEQYLQHVNIKNDNYNTICSDQTDNQCCKLEKFSETKSDDDINSKNMNSNDNDYCCFDENFNHSAQKVQNTKETYTKIQDTQTLVQKGYNRSKIVHHHESVYYSETKNLNKPTRKSLEINTNESSDPEKALLAAGLPTAFGKSTNKIMNRKSQIHANQNRTNKIEISQTRNARSLSQESLHTQAGSSTSVSSVNKNDFNTCPKKSANKQKTPCKSTKGDNQTERSKTISEEYTTWYRLLKLQTKQIELAIYIYELSKL